jgi:branched-subunit amino acid transport protein
MVRWFEAVMENGTALLKTWLKRARESAFAHYAEAQRCSIRHYFVGIPACVLSAIVATTVFASLDASQTIDTNYKIVIGMISVITSVLTALQTFLRFSEKADQHRSIAGKYSSIRRRIEQILVFGSRIDYDSVDRIRKELDELAATAPDVSDAVWKKINESIDRDYFLGGTSTEVPAIKSD